MIKSHVQLGAIAAEPAKHLSSVLLGFRKHTINILRSACAPYSGNIPQIIPTHPVLNTKPYILESSGNHEGSSKLGFLGLEFLSPSPTLCWILKSCMTLPTLRRSLCYFRTLRPCRSLYSQLNNGTTVRNIYYSTLGDSGDRRGMGYCGHNPFWDSSNQ